MLLLNAMSDLRRLSLQGVPLRVAVWLLIAAAVGRCSIAAEPVDYEADIRPILETYCIGCHTEGDAGGGLVLDSYETLMAGGERGAALTPGVANSSRMIQMLTTTIEPVMPPDDMEGPTEEELEMLIRWIEAGAAGPTGAPAPLRQLRTPEIAGVPLDEAPITAVAAGPRGIVAVARYGSVELRNGPHGEVVARLPKQIGKVNSLEFSGDGQQLLVASGVTGLYGQAAAYRVEDGQQVGLWTGHRDTMFAARFSPDGEQVATASYDATAILWDRHSDEQQQVLEGHNGAIFDLAYAPDGSVIVTASADETFKVWSTHSGERLDTLSQPQAEAWSVCFTADGEKIVGVSGDNRIRGWKFVSRTVARINPILATRFADESALVAVRPTADPRFVVTASADGHVRLIDTRSWETTSLLGTVAGVPSQLAVTRDDAQVLVSTLSGGLHVLDLSPPTRSQRRSHDAQSVEPVYLSVDSIETIEDAAAGQSSATAHPLPRGATATGVITAEEKTDGDWYRFAARRGEVWSLTVGTPGDSGMDPQVEVRTADGGKIERMRLQSVRDSYFTFRGKDSTQSNDFRLFAWEEMSLDEYLYAGGEVTRLWMYPRGPDSGFNVYPGTGNRWTYFGTSPVAHALHEPAYVVTPLAPGAEPAANGLPTFPIYFENDDDPLRNGTTDSHLLFTAPADGIYTIRISDCRGFGGDNFRYSLALRPAEPDFNASASKIAAAIPVGGGREFSITVERLDGFDGPIECHVEDVPEGVYITNPVVVEQGQREAVGIVYAPAGAALPQSPFEPVVIARAEILGRIVEKRIGSLGTLSVGGVPKVQLAIVPDDETGDRELAKHSIEQLQRMPPEHRIWEVDVRPGETVTARVLVQRNDFDGDLSLGKEFSGRNMPHGVYVDNIGLNGLLVEQGETDRRFFITADPITRPQTRLFHLKAEIDGDVTSLPVRLNVIGNAPDARE